MIIENRDTFYAMSEQLDEMLEALAGMSVGVRSDFNFIAAQQALIEAKNALEELGEFVHEVRQDLSGYNPESGDSSWEFDYFAEDLQSYADKHG